MSSCHSAKQYLESSTPQEQGLKLTKISDETQNSIIGNRGNLQTSNWTKSSYGRGGKGFMWDTGHRLAVSPDGNSLAYISIVDDQFNIMVRRVNAGSTSTQRTFRRAETLDWGTNNLLYFNDNTGNNSAIGSTDANKGSLVKQLTNNNNDWYPALTKDGSILYFTRFDNSGPSIWMLSLKTGELTNCTRGYCPRPIGDSNTSFLCVRNSPKGNSEIWLIDLENSNETIVLSDSERGFTDPDISPDGKWMLVVGDGYSSITKHRNTDIFAAKIDGSNLTQLTYHPETDCSPVWSSDGRFIYFISSRANKDRKFNIWRMTNPLM